MYTLFTWCSVICSDTVIWCSCSRIPVKTSPNHERIPNFPFIATTRKGLWYTFCADVVTVQININSQTENVQILAFEVIWCVTFPLGWRDRIILSVTGFVTLEVSGTHQFGFLFVSCQDGDANNEVLTTVAGIPFPGEMTQTQQTGMPRGVSTVDFPGYPSTKWQQTSAKRMDWIGFRNIDESWRSCESLPVVSVQKWLPLQDISRHQSTSTCVQKGKSSGKAWAPLGGSGACSPGKFLKIRCDYMHFRGFEGHKIAPWWLFFFYERCYPCGLFLVQCWTTKRRDWVELNGIRAGKRRCMHWPLKRYFFLIEMAAEGRGVTFLTPALQLAQATTKLLGDPRPTLTSFLLTMIRPRIFFSSSRLSPFPVLMLPLLTSFVVASDDAKFA